MTAERKWAGQTHLERKGHERTPNQWGQCSSCVTLSAAEKEARRAERVELAASEHERQKGHVRVADRWGHGCLICRAHRLPPTQVGSRKWKERWSNEAWFLQWLQEHRENARIRTAQRRGRVLKAGGTFTQADVLAQLSAQGGKCYWCKGQTEQKYHVDHRIPLPKGGSNDKGNIVIACPHCNLSKCDKMPSEFTPKLRVPADG